ncbi:blastoderm-specific protein 25d [Anaeramoeba flamelloides]|uniref:Blastoderm-specific protein 25d n=1 Tax=Anaeramoeba flamelloides TaxID=1746091 RepID=A0ABQ8Y9U0_9EUKA|nr:blastoderm-specific protein 25d [Anaeramoeba flamelloides]
MGNSENSHKIKKRHKKKYFKKLESSGLSIAFVDLKYKIEFITTATYRLFKIDAKKLTGNENILRMSKPYQTKFKCDSQKAALILGEKVKESKDGTYMTEWETITGLGEDLDLWVRLILIQIGKKQYIQVIFQPRSVGSQSEENKGPSSVDNSIIKVEIDDNTSSMSNSEFSIKTSPSINSNNLETKTKTSKSSDSSQQPETSIERLMEIDEIIDIVDEIKNKIRSLKEPEHEKIMVQNLNLLVETVEKQKNDLYDQTVRLIKKSKEQNLKNRKRYKELEKQFETRSKLLSKEKDKVEKLESENQLLKEQSQKYANFILTLNKNCRKFIKQDKISTESKKKIETPKQN